MSEQQNGRRDFLKAGAALGAAAILSGNLHAEGKDEIKVGLIGCGGRGSGAGENVLEAAPGVRIVALGDAFEDRAKGCKNSLENWAKSKKNIHNNKVDVQGNVHVGLDAYKKVLDTPGLNYVILATPPGFRPTHLEAAVAAGKNIFTEKPVAVDGPGIRKVLAAADEAKKKKLAIVAGTQRRHQTGYLETMKRIHGGDIGDIVGGRCYWMQGILWSVPRKEGMSDLVWQVRNWYNFVWLCGDHIVEQHIHNIDVINWATQAHPVAAVGMGYRTRAGGGKAESPDFGHIYDFFAIDFEYPKGVHVESMCRQISGCADSVSEAVVGTKGMADVSGYRVNGKSVFNRTKDNKPYTQEHTDLIASIRKGEPLNELQRVAESTLTAIMGRMSAYTGKRVTWEMALESKENTMPEQLAWDMKLAVPPVAVPGKTEFR